MGVDCVNEDHFSKVAAGVYDGWSGLDPFVEETGVEGVEVVVAGRSVWLADEDSPVC